MPGTSVLKARLASESTRQPPHLSQFPGEARRRWPLASVSLALLSAGLLTTAAIAVGTADAAKPVDLRVGEHRFRIPRAYFRHPPHPSGVDIGFYVRALWPDMEPETEETRAAFRASIRTEERQRVLQILFESNQPGMPWPVARWMLQNAASAPGAAEADRADLEAFAPASPETFGLRARLARPEPGVKRVDNDLFHGALADGRFVGVRCGREPEPDPLTSCKLWFDWRQGTWLQVTFIRTQLPRWREVAKATLTLVDGFAAEAEARADDLKR